MKHLLLLAMAVALLLAAPVRAQPPDWKTIRIGVEGAYPPFSEIGADGKLKGFEIELVQAYCAQMRAQCTLVQQDFDGLIPALQSGKVDAIFASLSITEERAKLIGFSKPYLRTPARLVARANAKLEPTAAGLRGKKIGVQRGTTHEAYAVSRFTQSEIVRYGSQDQIFLDLKRGRIDATLMDGPAAAVGFLAKPEGKGFAFIGAAIQDKSFGSGIGVGVRKDDQATLGAKFDAAISALQVSGGFARLAGRYFADDLSPANR
ncbi:MAG: transporter substrate-binding domain-containing protein [Burkholderiales bacterium]|nr:MAG: transporter substrate-binding domain-containing protein [Burkholderiales bacterium]